MDTFVVISLIILIICAFSNVTMIIKGFDDLENRVRTIDAEIVKFNKHLDEVFSKHRELRHDVKDALIAELKNNIEIHENSIVKRIENLNAKRENCGCKQNKAKKSLNKPSTNNCPQKVSEKK